MERKQTTCACPCHQEHTEQQAQAEEEAYWRRWAHAYLAQGRLGPTEEEVMRLAAQFFREQAALLDGEDAP